MPTRSLDRDRYIQPNKFALLTVAMETIWFQWEQQFFEFCEDKNSVWQDTIYI